MNWQEVVSKVNRDAFGKSDATLKQSELMMNGVNGELLFSDGPNIVDIRRGKLTDWSSRQLFERLGIPTQYARRMPPQLLAENVNHWLNDEPDRDLLIRYRENEDQGRGSDIRAILSGRYRPYDNQPVIDAVDRCLEGANVQVEDFHLDELGFHLKMSSPDLMERIGTLPEGGDDIITSGFYVTNSEVGARAVRIGYFVKRLICSNGLIGTRAKDFFYQRHVGLSENAFQIGVAEGVGAAFRASQDTIANLVDARKRKVEMPSEIIRQISKANRLSQQFTDQALVAYGIEQSISGDTDFSVIQAFTRAAQNLDPNSRVEVEMLAGYMLDNSLVAASRKNVVEALQDAVA